MTKFIYCGLDRCFLVYYAKCHLSNLFGRIDACYIVGSKPYSKLMNSCESKLFGGG